MPDKLDMPDTSDFSAVPQTAIIEGNPLKVVSNFAPSGDQPEAIASLVGGLQEGEKKLLDLEKLMMLLLLLLILF